MMITRSFLAAALVTAAAFAAPPLTTIQDVLYKADGTRFNGTLTISWTSFEAMDASAIATQSITTKVVEGALRVQLVPTTTSTPATYYSVKYNSDGRIQFEETWSVPSSAQPLRVRDVRVASNGNQAGSDTGGGTPSTPVQESDITGLIADLGARPLKGASFAAGRVAMVNALGALDAVTGSPMDCVRVDGSSGPCGAASTEFVDAEAPSGIVDGANTTFSLTATPTPASSLVVYRNGLLMKAGSDYDANGRTIQFVAAAAPQPGDTLLASYRLAESGAPGEAVLYPSPQVLCSGVGGATGATSFASLGTCSIPAGLLAPGDRVEIRFDLEHSASDSGYAFSALWGSTTMVQRDASASDALVTGRADVAVTSSGAQLSHQSWGSALPFAAGVGSLPDSYSPGILIDFRGKLAQAGGPLAPRAFSVVRVP
jgi:hypothetical protein